VLVFIATSVSAAQVSYSTAGIGFFASVNGGNELVPGTESDLVITFTNNAQYQLVATESGLQPRYDVATPYQLRVSLEGADGITVKTNTQFVSEIDPGKSVILIYRVSVDQYAISGPKNLKVHVVYNELFSVENYGDALRYYWLNDRVKDVPLEVTIRSQVSPEILEIFSENISVGTSGFLTLAIKNAGGMDAKNAYASIIPSTSGGSTPAIIPVEGSIFIGDFPAGSTQIVTFKISVANNAEVREYPLSLQVVYQDGYGVCQRSSPVIVGVPVDSKVEFKVTHVDASLAPGDKGLIKVTYENIGNVVVYGATARLSAVDPFSSNDDSSYLGDMNPGDSVVGVYEITVDGSATEKKYGIDTQIRYHDVNGNSIISKSMKAVIDVKDQSRFLSLFTNSIIIIIVIAIVSIGGYYVFMKRKGNV
jgi:hypothetical protein